MKIALIGYGKMGKEIEKIALSRGHTIVAKIDIENSIEHLNEISLDAAIEFTGPESAFENLHFCISNNIPVISGTTGWLERKEELDNLCIKKGGVYLYSSNYSIGVNIYFAINRKLAEMMNPFKDYSCKMTEIHHTTKLDAPSGTGITLAEDIINNSDHYREWINDSKAKSHQLPIISKRIANAPGTHIIEYNSSIDNITISHEAKSRVGFATGAVIAAEWINGKSGVFSMNDVLNID